MTSFKFYLTFLFLINSFFIYAQTIDLKSFNAQRIKDTKTDMLILGGWALGNMAVSGILLKNTVQRTPFGEGVKWLDMNEDMP